MSPQFLSAVLAVNSVLWFGALCFMSYGFAMLIISLDWRIFLLSIAIFAAVSLTEIVLTAISH